jgi:hypothetical protein
MTEMRHRQSRQRRSPLLNNIRALWLADPNPKAAKMLGHLVSNSHEDSPSLGFTVWLGQLLARIAAFGKSVRRLRAPR